MDFDRYLDSLRVDAALLAGTARRDLARSVPPCPGWIVADVVEHVAYVYQHKIACMRLGHPPDPWPPARPPGDLVAWLDLSLTELIAELTARGPAAPSWTWHAPDQTVGFWYRRMAQETAVHRIDAELAFGAATPISPDIAVDGVDEILDIILTGDWSDAPQGGPERTLRLDTGINIWEIRLTPTRVLVEHGRSSAPADATVSGAPDDLLLWLWGRRDLAALHTTGDSDTALAVRERLRLVPQ